MSDIRESDLIALGTILLNVIATVEKLGHSSPADTLTYMHGNESHFLIVKDFITWTAGWTDKAGARERLLWLVNESGWSKDMVLAVQEYVA